MDIFVQKDESQLGPYSADQIQQLFTNGLLIPTDKGWTEGLVDWVPLGLIVVGTLPVSASSSNKDSDLRVSRRNFRILLALTLMVMLAAIIAAAYSPFTGPPSANDGNTPQASTGTGWLPFLELGVWIVSFGGLFLFKKWGRILFAIMAALTILTTGEESLTAAENISQSLFQVLSGSIVALSVALPIFTTGKENARLDPTFSKIWAGVAKQLQSSPPKDGKHFGFIPAGYLEVIVGIIFGLLALGRGVQYIKTHWFH